MKMVLFRSNKKAQFAEYVGIALLLIALTLFIIFSRITTTTTTIAGATAVIKTVEASEASTFAVNFPYIRTREVPVAELMGGFVCYGSDNIDYIYLNFNASTEIRKVADKSFGKDKWALRLDSNNPSYNKGVIKSTTLTSTLDLPRDVFSYDFIFALPCSREFIGKGELYVWD